MVTVEFNALPQQVRQRIVSAFAAPKQPPVLGHEAYGKTNWGRLFVAGPVGALITISTLLATLDAWTIKPSLALFAIMAVGVLLMGAGGTAILARLLAPPRLQRGVYVVPGYCVVVEGSELRVVPWATVQPSLQDVTRRRNNVESYSATRLVLRLPAATGLRGTHILVYDTRAAAEAAWQNIGAYQDAFARAYAAGDQQTLASMDLFVECTMTGTWAAAQPDSTPPIAKSQPRWATAWLSVFLLVIPVGVHQLQFAAWQGHEEAARKKRLGDVKDGKKSGGDKYKAASAKFKKAVTNKSAVAFVTSGLKANAKRGKNVFCEKNNAVSKERLTALDDELTKLHKSAGEGFRTTNYSSTLGSTYWPTKGLEKALGGAMGDDALEIEGAGTHKKCPTITLTTSIKPTSKLFTHERLSGGGLEFTFVVETTLPPKKSKPAFTLVVPPPDAAALTKALSDFKGASSIYNMQLTLAHKKLDARLQEHFGT